MTSPFSVGRPLQQDTVTMFVILLLILVVSHQIYQAYIYPRFVSPLRHLPGPKDGHYLLGQALNQFKCDSPNEPFVSWVKKWPGAHLIRYPTPLNGEAVLVTSLDAYRDAAQKLCYSLPKPSFFRRLLKDITGTGVFMAEGDEHKKQRKFLSGPFAISNLKTYVPMVRNKALQLSDHFDEVISRSDGIVNVIESYSHVILEITSLFLTGVDLKDLGKTSTFNDCYTDMFEPSAIGQILMIVDMFIPVRWIPLEANRVFFNAKNKLHEMVMGFIKDRIRDVGQRKRTDSEEDVEKAKDMLTFIVEERYFGTDREKWAEAEMLEQMLNFFVAGHETSSNALSWGTHLLAKYPSVQSRLRTEIKELLRQTPEPTYSDLESMHYMNNFFREMLRFRAPPINTPREALEDIVIQGVKIPKGTTVMMMPAVIHSSPAIWGRSCDEFNPDRWDNLPEGAKNSLAFATFHHGPRGCLGKVLASIEVKTMLVEILSRFELELIDSGEVELINPSVLLRAKNGLSLRVKRLVD